MQLKQTFINTIIVYAGVLIGILSLLVLQPIYLTKEEIGINRLLIAFASLFSMLCSFSVNHITIKFFPYFKDENKKHNGFFGLSLLIPLIGNCFGFIVLLLFKEAIVSFYSGQSKILEIYIYHAFALSVLLSFILALNTYCISLFKVNYPSFLNEIIIRLLFIALLFLYAVNIISYNQFIILLVLSYGVQILLLLIFILIKGKPSLKINKSILNKIGLNVVLKYGFIVTITGLLTIALKFIDVILLGYYKGNADVGIYSVAFLIVSFIEIPLHSFERVSYPKVATLIAENNLIELKKLYYKSVHVLTPIGGLLVVLVIANIKDVLLLIPNDYSKGIEVVIILCVGSFVNMAMGINYSLIINSNKYYLSTVFMFITILISILLNCLLIPKYGIIGAAISTLIAGTTHSFFKWLFIFKMYKLQPVNLSFIKVLGVSIMCFIITVLLPNTSSALLSIIYKSLVIVGCYVTLLYWFKIILKLNIDVIKM